MKPNSRTSIFIASCFVLLSFAGIAQSFNATVVGVVSMGTEDYCFISEDGTANVYKTSPFTAGELVAAQSVELTRTRIQNQIEVTASSLTAPLFGMLEVPLVGQSIYYPDVARLPELMDGILYFDDEAHVNEVYDMITLFLEDDSYKKELDTKLDEIETNEFIGFTSFRTYFNTRFNWRDGEFTDQEMDVIYDKDYVNDEIMKTFLNEHGLVAVGEQLYVWLDNDIVYSGSISETNIGLFEDAFDNLDLGKYDIFQNGNLAITNDIYILSSMSTWGTKSVVTGSNGLSYTTEVKTDRDNCDEHYFVLQVWAIYTGYMDFNILDDPNEFSVATLYIDWADGSTETIANYTGQPITHHYVQSGTLHPQTTLSISHDGGFVTINDGTGATNTQQYPPFGAHGVGLDIEFISYAVCTNSWKEEKRWDVEGSWKMASKAWVQDFWILGSKIGAYTHSWKWENNKWKRKKSNISAHVHGEFKDNSCILQEVLDKQNSNNMDKKVQQTKSKTFHNRTMGGPMSNWTKHNLELNSNSVNIWRTIDIDPCH